MIRIAVVGDIGSGKSHLARLFGYPVFDADKEVSQLYRKNKDCYIKLKKILPTYINSFPIKKKQLSKAIIDNQQNLKKIIKIVHPQIRKRLNKFIRKNKNQKIVILDIPLLIENKINNKKDVLVFVEAKKKEINKRLKKRLNFNLKIIRKLKKFQLPIEHKKKRSDFIVKNNFNNRLAKNNVKVVLNKILLNARDNIRYRNNRSVDI